MAITGAPQRAGYPLTWKVPAGILPRPSWVKIGQVRTLATDRLDTLIGRIEERDIEQLVKGLNQLVG
jgi:mRNA interferase MazF